MGDLLPPVTGIAKPAGQAHGRIPLMQLKRRTLLDTLLGWLGGTQLSASSANAAMVPAAVPAAAPEGSQQGLVGGYILPGKEEVLRQPFDLVVVGGGISGTCAAIAAAREGARTALVHERSMLGGNSSSEVRLYPEISTNHNVWCKETGILDELHVEERRRNHEPYVEGLMNSVWDLVLYEWVMREKNLTLFLNTSVTEVEMKDPATILAIHGNQMGTDRKFVLSAPLFVDATGNGALGYRAGAEFRWGMEAANEFGESEAPPQAASQPQMGSTLYFRARDAGVPVPFEAPSWAPKFLTEGDLAGRSHQRIDCGYWWIEVGLPHNQIHDNEAIRHQALAQLLGVWDHIKNHCVNKDKARNFGLDFVGFWPYRREARRLMGDYILTQKDCKNPAIHNDTIAFGCWFIDVHKPGGILARNQPNATPPWENRGTIPYGIPLRSCYSRNVHNMLMAGRPISTSYIAFSSTRVLRTGAIVGQGVGIAAALCAKHKCQPRELAASHASELRQVLMREDAFLPGAVNEDEADFARHATITAGSSAKLIFPEGIRAKPLQLPLAQLFPVSSNRIESIELLLESQRDDAVTLTAGLRQAEFVYDFRSDRDIAHAAATIPPRFKGYVRFPFDQRVDPMRLYYIHLPPAEGIAWSLFTDTVEQPDRSPVGCTAAELPGTALWHPLTGSCCLSMRIHPDQLPYGPENAVRGTNRPDRWTNLYASDPNLPLPAWLELRLPEAKTIDTIQVTFDTDINRHARSALFVYPNSVKRYDVMVEERGAWKRVAGETANYMRRRVLSFSPVRTDKVRIEIHETNGAPSARIYEVRLYNRASVAL
ncbi:MAG: FAD-dependent oxidoreductase [Acidobacteriota bacterium]